MTKGAGIYSLLENHEYIIKRKDEHDRLLRLC